MQTLLEQTLNLTQKMLNHAEQQQWDELQALQPQQAELIEQIRQEAPKTPLSETEAIAEGERMLRQIKTLNDKIATLAEAQKIDAVQHRKVLNTGRKMQNLYGQNSRNRF